MDKNDNLDLLDLEDTNSVDTLPEATPFTTSRPKKPWLLMGLGLAIIILATWIIVAKIGGDSATSVSVDLDTPTETVDEAPTPVADLHVPPRPVDVAPQPIVAPLAQPDMAPRVEPKPEPKPVAVAPVENDGTPVRVISDRKNVTFNPDKPAPKKKPVAKPAKQTTSVSKPVATSNGSIYVQFGSYSTRELAQKAEKKIRASHSNLFTGKQFVILAAQVNGKTTYRLRVAFQNSNDANGFCRNAKSDGLDCYVTK